jgi:hypothetical protein
MYELLLHIQDDVEIHEAVQNCVRNPKALRGEHRGVEDLREAGEGEGQVK